MFDALTRISWRHLGRASRSYVVPSQTPTHHTSTGKIQMRMFLVGAFTWIELLVSLLFNGDRKLLE